MCIIIKRSQCSKRWRLGFSNEGGCVGGLSAYLFVYCVWVWRLAGIRGQLRCVCVRVVGSSFVYKPAWPLLFPFNRPLCAASSEVIHTIRINHFCCFSAACASPLAFASNKMATTADSLSISPAGALRDKKFHHRTTSPDLRLTAERMHSVESTEDSSGSSGEDAPLPTSKPSGDKHQLKAKKTSGGSDGQSSNPIRRISLVASDKGSVTVR